MAAAAKTIPMLFETPAPTPMPATVADDNSLFELDRELDALLERIEDEIEENGEASKEAMDALELFAKAIHLKINRIGGYLAAMETRAAHCRTQAERFATRARCADNKILRTKRMVLEYLAIHELKKVESDDFTLRRQKNSVDSVTITNAESIPAEMRSYGLKVEGKFWHRLLEDLSKEDASALKACVKSEEPSNSAIKEFVRNGGSVDGATVRREFHLRVE
jgi:hypothetical protein